MGTNARIKGLNGIRALCAMFILWGHVSQRDFCQWEISSLPLPECCAYVFFVISGFLAGYRIDSINGFLSYCKKKACRLLPLYYLYLVVCILVYIGIGRVDQILNSRLWYYLLLVPQIPFCSYSGILPLVHLWFIGTIVLFYVLFPFFSKIKKNKRVVGAAGIAAFWLLMKLLFRAVLGTDSVLYRFTGVTSLDILFLGVWAGLLMKEENPMLDKVIKANWLGLIAWLLFLSSGFYGRLIPAPIRAEFIALLALIIILNQQSVSSMPNLEVKILDWLGSLSYEVYVSQIIVIISLSLFICKLKVDIPTIIIYFICTAMVIWIAWCFQKASSKIVEKLK